MTGIDFVCIFVAGMTLLWWRIYRIQRSTITTVKKTSDGWKGCSHDWQELYKESRELNLSLKEIVESRGKDIDFLKKICQAWQVMAPMSVQEAIRTREDAIQYLAKLDQVMGFATDSELQKGIGDDAQCNLAEAVVKMERTRAEIETFLDNFQD